jgi:hypothetical protein
LHSFSISPSGPANRCSRPRYDPHYTFLLAFCYP